jgi:hypothetical protein
MPGAARVRWAIVGLGLALATVLAAPFECSAANPSTEAPTIYHKSRAFRIPFQIEPNDKPRVQEVRLQVSEDSGFTWRLESRTTPDKPSFTFRAARDAEYWFAVQTVDTKGKLNPPESETIAPRMKVVVDTTPPSLVIEPQGRRGSQASVRWEVRDEHLDLPSFALEYQTEGARDWRQVPIRRPALIGAQSWDAGSADRIKVRASVADKAGNVQQSELILPDGTAANPELSGGPGPSDFAAPPPITPISSNSFVPGGDDPLPSSGDDPFPPPPSSSPSPASNPEDAADPFEAPGSASWANSRAAAPPGAARTQLVGSPRFPIQYAVDDAGPNGPALVELWITRDGGRTWSRLPEDTDRVSPYQVDVSGMGGDGTFGLTLVARSLSGLGDQPPAPGDPPQMWVEVDSAPPVVQLDPPRVGTGVHAGKVAIDWRVTDAHLASRPIIISYRPDQPGARWRPITERIDNTGRFIWTVPLNVPPRFHLRVDAIDTVGNRGFAETTESGPVLVDRTRPRGRIIGLDPSVRSGPSARPLR